MRAGLPRAERWRLGELGAAARRRLLRRGRPQQGSRKIITTFFEPFLYGKRAFVKTGSGQTQEKLRKRGCFLGVLLDKGADPVNVTLTVAASGAFQPNTPLFLLFFGGGPLSLVLRNDHDH